MTPDGAAGGATRPDAPSAGPHGAGAIEDAGGAGGWRVRAAEARDVADVAAGVAQLLAELGGTPPPPRRLERAASDVIADPQLGCVFVADAPGRIVGVLAASWQHAIHVPGRYGLLQDLWVRARWRSRGVGGTLLRALIARAGEEGVRRIEVGLPTARFAERAATMAFYRANGFVSTGPRMRRLLP